MKSDHLSLGAQVPILSDQPRVKRKMGELTEFAGARQREFDATTSPELRKERGHFGTPAAIAEFMAGLFSDLPEGAVRILDPGAGVGTLSAAVCDRVLRLKLKRHLQFELWEDDPKLVPFIERTMDRCRTALRAAGHDLAFTVRCDDFILANRQRTLFFVGPDGDFDLAILNPPYFKLRKESSQAQAMPHVVYGQPNIYALFMAVAAERLVGGGQMVAITPRSYFNGLYFKRFRRWFFSCMAARQIHVFESRTAAFKDDAVLQENVILHAEKQGPMDEVILSSSAGRDLQDVQRSASSYKRVIDDADGHNFVRVTAAGLEHDVVAGIDELEHRIGELGLEISTGPVVSFRATKFLRAERDEGTAPLLWLHNIRPFVTRFPERSTKPGHITVSEASRRLLVPSRTYVVLKRFTAKEEKRRLVAGIVRPEDSYSEWIGLENHLNYVYRPGSELTMHEATGLAAYFNSALVDRYFRAISGNTQVNATEIRAMPMPDMATFRRIGQRVAKAGVTDESTINRVVCEATGMPEALIDQLVTVAG